MFRYVVHVFFFSENNEIFCREKYKYDIHSWVLIYIIFFLYMYGSASHYLILFLFFFLSLVWR